MIGISVEKGMKFCYMGSYNIELLNIHKIDSDF